MLVIHKHSSLLRTSAKEQSWKPTHRMAMHRLCLERMEKLRMLVSHKHSSLLRTSAKEHCLEAHPQSGYAPAL